ncbi:MAG: hypothetical protein K2J08_02345 [Ruminococcus sp.]|nr:hypothetical protein [Ruminococcus sp.]
MDIIESLLGLGSAMVDSMISTSKTYSKDERFTPEGREYYKELNQALTMAKDNLEAYKQKRESSSFEKLYSSATSNSKLNKHANRTDILKLYTLIDVYFGIYRGKKPFYFFDQESSKMHDKILEYLTYPYGVGKKEYKLTPILAISDLDERSSLNAFSEKTVVFCEEGIAWNFNQWKFYIVSYANVKQVYKRTKKTFLTNKCDVFLVESTGGFTTSYVMQQTYPAAANLGGCNANERNLIASSIYNFIRCFNSDCIFIDK